MHEEFDDCADRSTQNALYRCRLRRTRPIL
jgi:hypothetical protein